MKNDFSLHTCFNFTYLIGIFRETGCYIWSYYRFSLYDWCIYLILNRSPLRCFRIRLIGGYKINVFIQYIVTLTANILKYTLFAEKNVFIWKKSFIMKMFFTEKNFFYREKYKWKCKNIYISFEKYIFMQKMFVLQIKYKSFLNIYSFCKKKFLIIKNIFVKTSLWTQ